MIEEIEKKLRELLEDEFDGLGDFSNETALFTTSVLDSLALIKIMSFINEEFDVSIEPADITIANIDTVSLWAKLIVSKT